MKTVSAKHIRQIILEESKRAHVGHIASALSVADIIAVLFDGILSGVEEQSPNRDRFVLSKGHAALALYAALFEIGLLTQEQLHTYCADGSMLGTHPETILGGVDFCTGSLGQGLSMGVGAALAARLDKSSRRTFVLVSDAECNEGSLWEAVMFAAQHKLGHLTVIIDDNGQQALGKTMDILNLRPFVPRWREFGWNAIEVDGHDNVALNAVLRQNTFDPGMPRVVVATTHAGHGVSYMEDQVRWHYMPMSDTDYQQALNEVEHSS